MRLLDISILLKHAFMAGSRNGTPDPDVAWTKYDPTTLPVYQRVARVLELLDAEKARADAFRSAIQTAIAECKLMAAKGDRAIERDEYFYRGVAAAVDTLEIYFAKSLHGDTIEHPDTARAAAAEAEQAKTYKVLGTVIASSEATIDSLTEQLATVKNDLRAAIAPDRLLNEEWSAAYYRVRKAVKATLSRLEKQEGARDA